MTSSDMFRRFGYNGCTFPGRTSTCNATHPLPTRGHSYPRLPDVTFLTLFTALTTTGPTPPSNWCPSGSCVWEWGKTAAHGHARVHPANVLRSRGTWRPHSGVSTSWHFLPRACRPGQAAASFFWFPVMSHCHR